MTALLDIRKETNMKPIAYSWANWVYPINF
jgi:hypothetical protein